MVMGVVTKPHAVVPDGLTVVCFSCSGRVIGYCSYYCSKHLTCVREGDSFCCGVGKVPCSGCGRWVWLHMTTRGGYVVMCHYTSPPFSFHHPHTSLRVVALPPPSFPELHFTSSLVSCCVLKLISGRRSSYDHTQ